MVGNTIQPFILMSGSCRGIETAGFFKSQGSPTCILPKPSIELWKEYEYYCILYIFFKLCVF